MAKIPTNQRVSTTLAPAQPPADSTGGPVSGGLRRGFSLVELVMVIVILAIAALGIIPIMSQGTLTQAYAAAEMVYADMEYARSLAMTRGGSYSVQFDTANESYQIQDPNGDVVVHPVNKRDYVVDFANHRDLGQVDIVSASFDSTSSVRFDYLGSPYNGTGSALNSGSVVIRSDAVQRTVSVEPVTGIISVSD